MLHDAVKEFMKKERRGFALQPAAPQGDAQGWSDDEAYDGEHRGGGVQFAESLQTTPGKYYNVYFAILDTSHESLLFLPTSHLSHISPLFLPSVHLNTISPAHNCPHVISRT
jgi:hypothetical protein